MQENNEINEREEIDDTENTQDDLSGPLDDDQVIDRWLSELSPGCTLVIRRLEPDWARGWLEEMHIQPDKRVDLEKIRNRWGGHRLSIRLRRKSGVLGKSHIVELYSFDPLRYGKKIEPDSNPWEKSEKKESTATYIPSNNIPPPPQQENSVVNQILQSQQALLMHMMQQKPTQQRDPQFQSLGDALKIVREIQGLSGQNAPDTSLSDMDGIGALVPVITSLLGKQDKPKLSPPQKPDQSITDQLSKIAMAGPQAAATACAQIFKSIPDKDRAAAIDSFCQTANIPLGDDWTEEDYVDDEDSGELPDEENQD